MICDFNTKICEAHCCAALHAAAYVKKAEKGRATENDLFQLVLLNQYLDSLDRYKNSLPLTSSKCGCGGSGHGDSCLSEEQAQSILNQIATICGGCTCNC